MITYLYLCYIWMPFFWLHLCVRVCVRQISIACHVCHLTWLHHFLSINDNFLVLPINLILDCQRAHVAAYAKTEMLLFPLTLRALYNR